MTWAPDAMTVPTSERKKPKVTMLVPSPSSRPARRRRPPITMSTALAAHTAR